MVLKTLRCRTRRCGWIRNLPCINGFIMSAYCCWGIFGILLWPRRLGEGTCWESTVIGFLSQQWCVTAVADESPEGRLSATSWPCVTWNWPRNAAGGRKRKLCPPRFNRRSSSCRANWLRLGTTSAKPRLTARVRERTGIARRKSGLLGQTITNLVWGRSTPTTTPSPLSPS